MNWKKNVVFDLEAFDKAILEEKGGVYGLMGILCLMGMGFCLFYMYFSHVEYKKEYDFYQEKIDFLTEKLRSGEDFYDNFIYRDYDSVYVYKEILCYENDNVEE